MRSILAGALALAAILATGPAFATTVTTSTGFLPTYIGPMNGDVDIASASAEIEGGNLVLSATAKAPIGTTPGAVYVWGINTDATTSAPFAVDGFDKVFFNDKVVVNPAALTAGETISGDTITDVIAISSLANVTVDPGQFGISLWPVAPVVGGGFAGFSEFVPGNGTFSAAPEPASWALMIMGFGGLGASLRSRRKQAATAA